MQLEELRQTLSKQTFQPLFATLSGAHLYGFESPDSDVDLRGAFVLPLKQVIGMHEPNETVSKTFLEHGLEIDLVCHDVLKFCRLLNKNSGEVLEQLYSDLVVWPSPHLDELRNLFQPHLGQEFYFHYRGFLLNQRRLIEKPEATVKETLYGYRVALTGIHLLKSGQVNANLPSLLELYPQEEVLDLIAEKQATKEHAPLDSARQQRHLKRLEQLQSELEEAHNGSPLPHSGGAFEELSEFVVRVRLGRS
ncbi:MAG: nucleotidyltransferase domain-containing protein [Candidatus Eremiobacteraeota bacterium]|nr:nucleotidyltransferase domain-containing protein [Candidatus Eremiobacteraeota bacterium]MCW5872410.1 nucleotidyltransferase domain-containing protein [Candidatus Eremiobacteraeota bacterium]